MSDAGDHFRATAVFNLSDAVALVVDESPFSTELTSQALLGFGIRTRHTCRNGADAAKLLQNKPIDLLLVDASLPDMDGHDLVSWLRRSGIDPNAFTPVIMTASHVRRSRLQQIRDCGANFLITKPFSAAVLLERILWVARDTRPFLQVGDYFGPDRRFRDEPPPDGIERRAGGRPPDDGLPADVSQDGDEDNREKAS